MFWLRNATFHRPTLVIQHSEVDNVQVGFARNVRFLRCQLVLAPHIPSACTIRATAVDLGCNRTVGNCHGSFPLLRQGLIPSTNVVNVMFGGYDNG